MWTDRALNAAMWGLTAAIPFSLLGALFGAWARLVGKWVDKVPEGTARRALVKGLWAGGLFLGAGGFAGGCVLGFSDLPSDIRLGVLAAALLVLAVCMVWATGVGGVAFGLEWLGSARSGQVIALLADGLFLATPIRAGVLGRWTADGGDVSPLGHLLVWAVAVLAGLVALAVLLGLVWLIRLVGRYLVPAAGRQGESVGD